MNTMIKLIELKEDKKGKKKMMLNGIFLMNIFEKI